MDGGILVISSPDGPMAQTREHILLSKQARAAECDALQIQNNKRCSLEQYLAAAQTATSQGGCAKARLLHEQGERRVCHPKSGSNSGSLQFAGSCVDRSTIMTTCMESG